MIDTPNVIDPDVFPLLPGQLFLQYKKPEWSTTIQESKSGRELRASGWSSPKWHFKVKYEFVRHRPPTQNELFQLYSFFNKRQGQFLDFHYFDPTDYAVTDQLIGYGNGLATIFQLTRSMDGWIESIYVVNGIPVIKFDGVVTAASYTINDYGQIEFDDPPPDGVAITWSGQFMYLCRFEQDDLSMSQMYSDLWSQDGLSFTSIKV
jgi:uncharacterized protein (TIGR02217 family)